MSDNEFDGSEVGVGTRVATTAGTSQPPTVTHFERDRIFCMALYG
jgi:hypothetical protein